jgi:TPR repeat protein
MQELEKIKRVEDAMRLRWIEDEKGWIKLPARAWPEYQPKASCIPKLRQQCAECDGAWFPSATCAKTKFDLATALVFTGEGPPEGVELYKALALQGNLDAMVATAITLIELDDGVGVEVDEEEGMRWLEKATQANSAQAEYEMAVCYYNGNPLAEDEPAAAAFFKRAAAQGHVGGMFMYGDCLMDGIGCEKDMAAAIPWMYAAAEKGHRAARSRILALLNSMDQISRGDEFGEGKFTDSSRLTLRSGFQDQKIDLGLLPQAVPPAPRQ